MHIKKGDKVQVMTGNEKGKIGEVLQALPKKNRVIVKDVNVQTKHRKPRSMQDPGGIFKIEGPIDASNVLLYDEKVGRGVRTRTVIEDGKKIRVSTKSETRFD